MHQDTNGYLWIGTGNGLIKYDGYDFKVYKSMLYDTNTLSNDGIKCISEDKHGNLWIGTQQGLNRFNPETEISERFLPDKNKQNSLLQNNVNSLFIDSLGLIYIGTEGLQVFNPGTKIFTILDTASITSAVLSILKDESGELLVSTSDGFFNVDLHSGITTRFPCTGLIEKEQKGVLNGCAVNQVMRDNFEAETFWLATNTGISELNKNSGWFTNYRFEEFNEKNAENSGTLCLYIEKSGKIWTGTQSQGIFIFNPVNSVFETNLKTNPLDPKSLSDNTISGITADCFGNLWIGTIGGGLNKTLLDAPKFRRYLYFPTNSAGLNDKTVWSIHEDQHNKVWIGTENNGIDVLDRSTGKFSYYTNKQGLKNQVGPGIVGDICEDKDGYIWAVTWSGTLNKIDPNTGNVKVYRGGPEPYNNLKGWSFRVILSDRDNVLWVGSWDKGIEIFDKKKEKSSKLIFGKYTIDDRISSLIQGKSGIIWCGTNTGIYAMNPDKKEINFYPLNTADSTGIQCNEIKALYGENDSILWIATQGCGLYRLNTVSGEVSNYDMKDGLPDNNIYAVCPDNHGHLWLSTGNGISDFDVTSNTFRNYDKSDGLQSNEFKWGAYFQNTRGEIFFGGINGFDIFNPDSIRDNRYTSKTVLTDFKISNTQINPGDSINGRVLLSKLIGYTDHLELSYKESDISFEFAALHFASSEKNKFAYIMKGYDAGWKYTDASKRFAVYTNMDPGNYTFRVKSSNNDGIWCKPEDEVALKIYISPPFWKTWWFRITIILIIFTAFYSLYLMRTHRLRLQKLVLEKTVSERTHEINLQKDVLRNQKEELAIQADNLQEANILLTAHSEELQSFSEELRVQGEELFEANEELIRLNATKDRLFSIIAHDLKNPFQAILGSSGLLAVQFNTLDENKRKQYIDNIFESARNAHNLLENLLEWARSQINRIEFRPEYISLVTIVQKAIQLMSLQASDKKISVTTDISEDHTAYADNKMVETIIRNFLGNAIKFTSEGGKIHIGFHEEANGMVCVEVADNGIGMEKDVLDKLFRIDEAHIGTGTAGEQGTGLGLILCREFAESNGGSIDAQSEPGKGSRFSLHLHRKKSSYLEYNSKMQSVEFFIHKKQEVNVVSVESVRKPVKDRYHLLIIDDNFNIRKSIVAQLEEQYLISEASDGKQALEIAFRKIPDMVISDVMMPEMDGFELCKILKEDKRTSHIPIILLTARVSDNSRMLGFNLGADEYITKPFNIEVLESRIYNLISQREKLRNLFRDEILLTPKKTTVNSLDEIFFSKIQEIIDKYMDDSSFNPGTLAHELGISRAVLYKKFKYLTDYSVNEYIQIIRIKRAAALLLEGNNSVTDAAYATGFKNPNHFSRVFSQYYHESPSKYMAEKKKE